MPENFGVVAHAVELEHHDVGDWIVVLGGAGPIGILAAQMLVAECVDTIINDLAD